VREADRREPGLVKDFLFADHDTNLKPVQQFKPIVSASSRLNIFQFRFGNKAAALQLFNTLLLVLQQKIFAYKARKNKRHEQQRVGNKVNRAVSNALMRHSEPICHVVHRNRGKHDKPELPPFDFHDIPAERERKDSYSNVHCLVKKPVKKNCVLRKIIEGKIRCLSVPEPYEKGDALCPNHKLQQHINQSDSALLPLKHESNRNEKGLKTKGFGPALGPREKSVGKNLLP